MDVACLKVVAPIPENRDHLLGGQGATGIWADNTTHEFGHLRKENQHLWRSHW